MELSSNLFNFLLRDGTLANETLLLVNPFLQMVASTLKLSQKRKIYQPHFTLSIEGLYQMYQTGSVYNKGTKSIKPELALEAILMNSPHISIFYMVPSLIHLINLFFYYKYLIIYDSVVYFKIVCSKAYNEFGIGLVMFYILIGLWIHLCK